VRLVDPARYQDLKASGRLPSPKGVAFAIVKLLRRDEYRMDDLARLVQSDPAIAGRLLQFANAAALANSRPIASISRAIMALGAFRVRDLVLGFSVLHGHRNGECKEFDYEAFWSRSLATAIAAQALADYSQISAEESFTLGLLADVGELALATLYPDQYGAVIAEASDNANKLLAAEQDAFDMDQRALGATMLAEWGLPQVLVSTVYHADAPDDAGFPDGSRYQLMALSLHFARTLARMCVASDANRWDLMPEAYTRAARLGINPDELASLADGIVLCWRTWGRTLQVQTRELPSFSKPPSAPLPLTAVGGKPPDAAIPERPAALVVCPDQTEMAMLQRILAADGFAVHIAANGTDALAAALHQPPELVLIEAGAGEIDGPAFCRSLRESPLGRNAYLILIGDRGEENALLQGMDNGADDFLLRPVTEGLLRARLRAVSRTTRLREEIRKERRGIVRTAHEWAGSNRRLMRVAMTDPLTGLPNRRRGMDFLAAEVMFSRAHNQSLSCLMIDIDHFKNINDEHGHEAGDQMLAQAARLLETASRAEDLAFRYGGEEFCVVCPGSDLRAAQLLAERVRTRFCAARFTYMDKAIAATVSIGVALMMAEHANGEDLLRDADTALYRAKERGRNRVETRMAEAAAA
jgi:two-component system cell cycle response regulator